MSATGNAPWTEQSIEMLAAAMAAGELTAEALTRFYLDRIEAYDQQGPALNAVQALTSDPLAQARALDAERARQGPRGPLHGIPVLVKDNYETLDAPTTAGSVLFEGFNPGRDATLVARLRAAGAVILGKTTMHEFAYGITTVGSAFGQTRNPYHLERNPGGSSGGTGAAVAANFAAAGFGSDTCGSIRIPAAQNNLVGLRGTQGLASRAGIVPLSSTQDIGGPLARSVTDLALLLDATVGADEADPQTAVMAERAAPGYRAALRRRTGVRIGVLQDWLVQEPPDRPVAERVMQGLDALAASAGWQLEELASPAVNAGVDRTWNGHYVLIYDFKADIDAYLASNPELGLRDLQDLVSRDRHHPDVDPSLKASLSIGGEDRAAYEAELAQRDVVREALVALMTANNLDALAYPTIRRVAAPAGREQLGTNCRLAANSGLPAISVPVGFDAEGLPVGLELLGEPFSEQKLLDLAYTVERDYPQRRPPAATP